MALMSDALVQVEQRRFRKGVIVLRRAVRARSEAQVVSTS